MSDSPLNITPTSSQPDPSVFIPKSVRDAAARAEAHYTKTEPAVAPPKEQLQLPLPAPPQVDPAPIVQEPAPIVQEPAPIAQEPAPIAQTAPVDAEHERSRYLAMKGRYDQSQKTIGTMQEQMAQLGDELIRTQAMIRQPHQSNPLPPRAQALLTPEDTQNYGPDLIDFTQRAAIAAVAPKLTELEEENARLRQAMSKTERSNINQRLEQEVPNWRDVNVNPRWLQWLRLPDVYSGRIRQQMLNDASSAGDSSRVVAFFKGFLAEEHATGHVADPQVPTATAQAPARQAAVDLATLASPGRPRPASGSDAAPGIAADKPVITRADISTFYSNVRQGAYRGQDALKASHERMIFEAQREGRVR